MLAIAPLTPAGRATARLLQFDRPQRVRERRLFVAAGILKIPDRGEILQRDRLPLKLVQIKLFFL